MPLVESASYLAACNGMVSGISAPLLKLIGFDREELLRQPVNDVFLTRLRASAHGVDFNALAEPLECYLFTKNLEAREVAITAKKDDLSGDTVYCIEEKPESRLEPKFLLAEQLLRDNIVGVVIYSVPDFTILKANQAFFDYVEEPNDKAECVIGRRLTDIILDPEANLGLCEAVQAEILTNRKTMFHHEIKGLTEKNIGRYWDEIWSTVHENGKLKYIVSIVIDVTERVRNRKIAQEQHDMLMRQQRKLLKMEQEMNAGLQNAIRNKNEFLATITHEFRTPVAVIDLAVQSLQSSCGSSLSAKDRAYLEYIRQNNYRQLRLVNNLLDLTGASFGQLRVCRRNRDIVQLTQSIIQSVHIFAEQKSQTIVLRTRAGRLVIGVDADKYERILLNLLSNAVKFSPGGKLITVSITRAKGFVCVCVRDEGIGIPKEKLGLVFERFGQVNSVVSSPGEGTGIGLALVRQYAEAMGGGISVTSQPGRGSAFRLLLPAAPAEDIEDPAQDLGGADERLAQKAYIEFSDIL